MTAISLDDLKYETRAARDCDDIVRRFRALAYEHGDMAPTDALRLSRKLGYRKETTLRFIDALTGCHGVESFESVGGFREYANTGDTYAETVILSPGGRFYVTTMGDILEQPSHDRWHRRRFA